MIKPGRHTASPGSTSKIPFRTQLWYKWNDPRKEERSEPEALTFSILLDLANVEHGFMDGESMLPYFEKGHFPMRPRYAENLFGCCSLVRKDNFKFLSVNLPSRVPKERGQKSVIAKYHGTAVFDLTADPWEYHNLIDTPKGKEVMKWAIEEHKRLKEV